jgi:hypothetical protein
MPNWYRVHKRGQLTIKAETSFSGTKHLRQGRVTNVPIYSSHARQLFTCPYTSLAALTSRQPFTSKARLLIYPPSYSFLCCSMYFFVLCYVLLCCSMYWLFCDVLCIVCVYMFTEQPPLGGYPIAVKYIISYRINALPDDGVTAPKYVGALLIYILMSILVFFCKTAHCCISWWINKTWIIQNCI